MQNPKLIGAIIKEVKAAVNIPVSAKIRTGFNKKPSIGNPYILTQCQQYLNENFCDDYDDIKKRNIFIEHLCIIKKFIEEGGIISTTHINKLAASYGMNSLIDYLNNRPLEYIKRLIEKWYL